MDQLPVELRLQHLGKLYELREQARIQRVMEKAKTSSAIATKISKKSLEILKEKEKRLGVPIKQLVEERLTKPIGTLKPRTQQELEREKLTFKPKITAHSDEILSSGNARWRSLSAEADSQSNSSFIDTRSADDDQHIERFLHNYYAHNEVSPGTNSYDTDEGFPVEDDQGNPQCVSTDEYEGPTTLLPPSWRPKHARAGTAPGSADRMFHKSAQWKKVIERRLEAERRERELNELKECSFVPQIHGNESFSRAHSGYLVSTGHTAQGKKKISVAAAAQLASKHVEWAKRRAERLAVEREKQAQEELRDCTFAPNQRPIKEKHEADASSPATSDHKEEKGGGRVPLPIAATMFPAPSEYLYEESEERGYCDEEETVSEGGSIPTAAKVYTLFELASEDCPVDALPPLDTPSPAMVTVVKRPVDRPSRRPPPRPIEPVATPTLSIYPYPVAQPPPYTPPPCTPPPPPMTTELPRTIPRNFAPPPQTPVENGHGSPCLENPFDMCQSYEWEENLSPLPATPPPPPYPPQSPMMDYAKETTFPSQSSFPLSNRILQQKQMLL